MTLEGPKPPHEPEKRKSKVVQGPLDIVKTRFQRGVVTGRRNIITLGAAAGASYVAAEVGAPLTTPLAMEKVMPERPSDLPKEVREEIQRQLKEFEDARKKGVGNWAEKWCENAKKGFDKHGFDVLSSMKEFSEEGLRARLLKYDLLKESYDTLYQSGYGAAYYAFYAAYAAATFYAVQMGLSDYFKHKSQYEKDRKIQNAVNISAEELAAERAKTERLQAALTSLEARVKELEARPLVSPEEFAALMDARKQIEVEASPLLLQDLSTRAPESPVDKKDEQA